MGIFISSLSKLIWNFLSNLKMVATDANNNAPVSGAKDQAFFAEEASRQILVRVASVLQDPDLCDATFVVEDGNEKEEIKAPTQFMAMSSPYFKSILYPQQFPQRKEVKCNQKRSEKFWIISLEVASHSLLLKMLGKLKLPVKSFNLKSLKSFVQNSCNRIDSRNLIHFLKNTSKYNTSDLRDVVITRFLKNADKGFEDEQMLDLTEGEMYDIMSRRPEVQARKVMEVLIKWAKKRYADKKAEIEKAKRLEQEKKAEEKRLAEKRAEEDRIMEETRLREEKEAEEAKKKEDEKDKEEPKKEDAKMEEDKVDGETTKKEEDKKEETKPEEKKEESKKDDDKKDEKKDEKKEGEEKKEEEKKDD